MKAEAAILTLADERLLAEVVRRVMGQLPKPRTYVVDDGPILAGGGTSLLRFTLLEDVGTGPEETYLADITQMDGTAVASEADLVDTYGWMGTLQLRAGDHGLACEYDGVYYYVTSDCGTLGACDGPFMDVGVGSYDATTADPFTLTLTTSGATVGSWAATGLPAGLTIDTVTGEISGTATTAGTYLVTLVATAEEDEGCFATRIITITVTEPA